MFSLTLPDSKTVVHLYDSTMAMPAELYQKAKLYEVMRAELGQSEDELNDMLRRASNYVFAGKTEEYQQQMSNYLLARSLVKQGYQAGQLDWACHVARVDDKPVTDYSEDGLIEQIKNWSALGLTQQLIEDSLAEVKKNSATN